LKLIIKKLQKILRHIETEQHIDECPVGYKRNEGRKKISEIMRIWKQNVPEYMGYNKHSVKRKFIAMSDYISKKVDISNKQLQSPRKTATCQIQN
jgi:hypothetical protein